MKKIFLISFLLIQMTQNTSYKIDFGKTKDGINWWVVNDGVMGGLSQGNKTLTENSILFKGVISLDNNGGFSSLRRSLSDKDLSQYDQIQIRYRSTGISKALTLSVSRRWYIPNYKISLEGTSGKWETKTIKISDIKKYYLGKPLNESLKKEKLKDIIRMGIITDEKKYGDFEFEVDYINFMA